MIVDCITRKKLWTEITPEKLAEDDGLHNLGEWLVLSLASIQDRRAKEDIEDNHLHLLAVSLTQEELDTLEVESLLEND